MGPSLTRRHLLGWAAALPTLGSVGHSELVGDGAGRVFDVRNFGAVGDGRTDDQPAIQRALDAAAAAGGGVVLVPPGDYLLATVQGDWRILLRPRPRVTVLGHGASSTLRAAPGLNRAVRDEGFSFFRHVVNDERAPRCDDFTVCGIRFDHNGAHNLIAQGIRSHGNMALGIEIGSRLRFEMNECLMNPGAQTLSFGSNSAVPSTSEVVVRGNVFRAMGGGVPGNGENRDHSTLYLQAEGGVVTGNHFVNDQPPRLNTALELHGTDLVASGNVVRNYAVLANIVAQTNDSARILLADNVGAGLRHAVVLWQSDPHRLDEVRIAGNLLERIADPGSAAPAFFDLDSNTGHATGSVRITDNDCRSLIPPGSPQALAAVRVGNAESVRIDANRFKGFPGRAIELGEVAAGAVLTVEGNEVSGCGSTSDARYQEALTFNGTARLGVLRVRDNLIRRDAGRSGGMGIRGNIAVSDGEVADNAVVGYADEVGWRGDAPPLLRHRGHGLPTGGWRWGTGSSWTVVEGAHAGRRLVVNEHDGQWHEGP